MAKTQEAYSEEARQAFLDAHYEEGQPWTRVVKLMRTGELDPRLRPFPSLSYSTARRWKDRHERQLVEAMPPDLATWQKLADGTLKVIARELNKLERDSKKPRPVDPDRVRKLLSAVKEAKPLASSASDPDKNEGAGAPEDDRPPSLLETLASRGSVPQQDRDPLPGNA